MLETMYDSGPAIEAADLSAVEVRLGCAIPLAYRQFLLRHNGGRPDPAGFWIPNKDGRGHHDWSKIRWFYGIRQDGISHSLEWAWAMMRDGRPAPPDLFPIAFDLGDASVCIATAGPGAGAVYYWDEEASDTEAIDEHVYKLAPSFADFLDALEDVGDAERS